MSVCAGRTVCSGRVDKPQAVLVDFEEFQRMKELAERWEDEALLAIARERLKRYEAGEIRALPYDELPSE